jgi:chorismate lyase/3-hydroxybenzoate synthase
MSPLPREPDASFAVALPLRPRPPAWVDDLLTDGGVVPEDPRMHLGGKIVSRRTGRFTLLGTAVREATSLSVHDFADAVSQAYRSLAAELTQQQRHALRFWNFVPDIHAPMGAAGDRYMVFNAGRFAAYSDWFGGPDAFSVTLPTSSGVGVSGGTLWMYVLGADSPGTPIENPRQSPSYHYSKRYGSRPPCFARATRFESIILIGGTASIIGEHSLHAENVQAQTRESLRNIAALIASAGKSSPHLALAALQDARVHVAHPEHAPAVRAILDELAPHLGEVEFVQADLCRKELLVEIEGRADCRAMRTR